MTDSTTYKGKLQDAFNDLEDRFKTELTQNNPSRVFIMSEIMHCYNRIQAVYHKEDMKKLEPWRKETV